MTGVGASAAAASKAAQATRTPPPKPAPAKSAEVTDPDLPKISAIYDRLSKEELAALDRFVAETKPEAQEEVKKQLLAMSPEAAADWLRKTFLRERVAPPPEAKAS